MPDALAQRVLDLIADNKQVPAETVTPDATFADLGIDSLDALNLAFAFEEEFNIAIPDDELRQIKTVDQAITGVRRLVDAKAAGDARAAS